MLSGRVAAGKDSPSATLVGNNIVNLFHTLFLCCCIGTVATPLTTYILLSIDFIINLYFAFQVFWQHRSGHMEACGSYMMDLVLNEFLELVVPVTYLLTFIMCFYGPNGNKLGRLGPSLI